MSKLFVVTVDQCAGMNIRIDPFASQKDAEDFVKNEYQYTLKQNNMDPANFDNVYGIDKESPCARVCNENGVDIYWEIVSLDTDSEPINLRLMFWQSSLALRVPKGAKEKIKVEAFSTGEDLDPEFDRVLHDENYEELDWNFGHPKLTSKLLFMSEYDDFTMFLTGIKEGSEAIVFDNDRGCCFLGKVTEYEEEDMDDKEIKVLDGDYNAEFVLDKGIFYVGVDTIRPEAYPDEFLPYIKDCIVSNYGESCSFVPADSSLRTLFLKVYGEKTLEEK